MKKLIKVNNSYRSPTPIGRLLGRTERRGQHTT